MKYQCLRRIGGTSNVAGMVDIMILNKTTSVIGRNQNGVDFYLDSTDKDAARSISRVHARVVRQEDNTYKIYDDSSTGIFVNDKKIHESTFLKEGDKVIFGCKNLQIPDGFILKQPGSEFQYTFETCDIEPPKKAIQAPIEPPKKAIQAPTKKALGMAPGGVAELPDKFSGPNTKKKPMVGQVTPEINFNIFLDATGGSALPSALRTGTSGRGRSPSPFRGKKTSAAESKRPVTGKTPYQGKSKCFGKFVCTGCARSWNSGNSWANTGQMCKHCNIMVYPCEQRPLKNASETDQKVHQEDLCEKCIRLGHSCMGK